MPETDYTKRRIEAHAVYSAHLSEERTIKVYLPPDYEEGSTYPVVYCHDGLEFFTHGRIATLANQLIAENRLVPIVIVGIAVKKETRTEDYAPGGERHDAYCQFVLDECVPFIESKYSVATSAEGRFMAGISLGAAATLSIYLKQPDEFHQLLLFSGAFYERVQDLVKAVPRLTDLSAYMVVGQQETAVETSTGRTRDFYQLNHAMRDALAVRGAKLQYSEAPGTHIWGFWQGQIPSALEWLNAQVQAKNPLS